MKLKTEQFGFWLLVFVGYCGEVPVSLVWKMNGCYDYNRRVVTKLVRMGYLKERKLKAEQRHIVRSLSLTEAGLRQIQHLSPNHAAQVRQHWFAPKDGQGDLRRTLRLHRGAACLLTAMKLGAVWHPTKAHDAARRKELVYYSTYQLNKSCGRDNKSARASGILVSDHKYYPVYYLENRNMRWNKETEQLFRDQFEQSESGHGLSYGGNILLGENWELAERIVHHAVNPRGRLIRFSTKDLFYYYTLDSQSIVLLRANVDSAYGYQLEHWLNRRCSCPFICFPDYLFDLETVAHIEVDNEQHWFFDFQIPVVRDICKDSAQLVSMSGRLLDEFAEGGDDDGTKTSGNNS